MAIPDPMHTINTGTVSLKLIAEEHAASLLHLVNNNRQYLRSWLPWVDHMQTVENFKTYIANCEKQHEEGTDYGYVIKWNEKIAGRIGIHYINRQNQLGSIGYWLGEEFSGKGIITKACAALISQCFAHLSLNRIEIKCATGNQKSAAVAERLGFTKEGILRQAELVNGVFLDLYVYSMLKQEWKN